MIVVDTNTIAYLYLPTDFTEDVEQLLQQDPHWVAPLLWRSELRNILALYLRKGIMEFDAAYAIQSQAESLLNGNEFTSDSLRVLKLCQQSGCSAYDCEFIALAETLNTRLVTADKKLLQAFPNTAISAKDYLVRSD